MQSKQPEMLKYFKPEDQKEYGKSLNPGNGRGWYFV